MPFYRFEGRTPSVHPSSYVHPSAVVIGAVTIGAGCYIGPGVVLRGDWGEISIADGSNVQENVVIHARPEQRAVLGRDSHIGHGAILHGCTLEEHVMVGMGAIVNDDAVIGPDCVIGSGAVIPPGMQVPARQLLVGVPARVLKEVDDRMAAFFRLGTALYQTLPDRYRESLEEITGATEPAAPSTSGGPPAR